VEKNNEQKDHPEVTDIEHICDISPKTDITKDVCEKVNKNHEPNQKYPKNDKSPVKK